MSGDRDAQTRHFVILSKLEQVGQPMNLLEIGFSASPQVIRNMAARGMVRVTVEMTPRGQEALAKERNKRLRKKFNEEKALRAAFMRGAAE